MTSDDDYRVEEVVAKPAWARKILCWVVLVSAGLAYFSGLVTAAVLLGIATVTCFAADFYAFNRDSKIVVASYRSHNDYLRVRLTTLAVRFALGIAIVVAAQLVMRFVYLNQPTAAAPSLCVICHR